MAEKTVAYKSILVKEKVAKRGKMWVNLYLCPKCGCEKLAAKADGQNHPLCHACANRQNRTTHNMADSKIYIKWQAMKRRCLHSKSSDFKHYGGRGIELCQQWHTFEGFMRWEKFSEWKPGLEIDRIDNNGNYEPSNCRWVSRAENTQNTRRNVLNREMARLIKRLHESGEMSYSVIAKTLTVSKEVVASVVSERSWRNA